MRQTDQAEKNGVKVGTSVISCLEFEEVELDVERLIASSQSTSRFIERAHRYFDVKLSEGRITLSSRGWVGMIPLSEGVTVHIRPRTPVKSVYRMLSVSGYIPETIGNLRRRYDATSEEFAASPALPAIFANAAGLLGQQGLLKKYMQREVDSARGGRLDLQKTVSRYRGRGVKSRHVFSVYELTSNSLENAALKEAAALAYGELVRLPALRHGPLLTTMTTVNSVLGSVASKAIGWRQLARSLPALLRGLPRSHEYYEPLLWIAVLMGTRRGFELLSEGSSRFQSVLVDMSSLFEAYVRNVLVERLATKVGVEYIRDGNKRPIRLFLGGQKDLEPDLYVKAKSGEILAADVKYKAKVKAADKYQLLAFCEGLGAKRGVLLMPFLEGGERLRRLGATLGGTEIYVLAINLCADDMKSEEDMFAETFESILSRP